MQRQSEIISAPAFMSQRLYLQMHISVYPLGLVKHPPAQSRGGERLQSKLGVEQDPIKRKISSSNEIVEQIGNCKGWGI